MKYYTWLIVEILLIAALISACFPKDFKTVHPEFIYGGISDNGKYDFEVKNSYKILKLTHFIGSVLQIRSIQLTNKSFSFKMMKNITNFWSEVYEIRSIYNRL